MNVVAGALIGLAIVANLYIGVRCLRFCYWTQLKGWTRFLSIRLACLGSAILGGGVCYLCYTIHNLVKVYVR